MRDDFRTCSMKRLIIFDMDGTLYGLDKVIPAVYEIQIDFLKVKKGWTRDKSVTYFNENCVFPFVSENSRSATRLFQEAGFDLQEWNEFREARFPFDAVVKSPAITDNVMDGFSKLGLCVLVTSNSQKNTEKILWKIGVDTTAFNRIVCNDTALFGRAFSKKDVFKVLLDEYSLQPHQAFSIGDRYVTDIEPMLKLGGNGVLVSAPESLSSVFKDMLNDSLETCEAYRYFPSAKIASQSFRGE